MNNFNPLMLIMLMHLVSRMQQQQQQQNPGSQSPGSPRTGIKPIPAAGNPLAGPAKPQRPRPGGTPVQRAQGPKGGGQGAQGNLAPMANGTSRMNMLGLLPNQTPEAQNYLQGLMQQYGPRPKP